MNDSVLNIVSAQARHTDAALHRAEEKLGMIQGLLAAYGEPEEGRELSQLEFLVRQIEAVLSDSDRVCGCEDGDD